MRLTALQQLYVKKQSAADTFAWSVGTTPTAAELLPVYDCTPPKTPADNIVRSGNARGAHTPLPARPGPRNYEGDGSLDLILPTSSDVLAASHASGMPFRSMLEAADLKCTYSAGTSAIYTPQSNQGVLLSAWHYLDGLAYKALDCKTGFSLTMDAGGLCKFAMKIVGRYYDVATGTIAAISDTSFASAHVAQLANTITLTIGGVPYSIDFASLNLDWNPTVKKRKGHKGQFGQIGTILTGREPKITINPDMSDSFDIAAIAGWEALTLCTLEYITSTAPYFRIYARGQIVQAPVENEEGEARHAMEFRLASENIENELQMDFVC